MPSKPKNTQEEIAVYAGASVGDWLREIAERSGQYSAGVPGTEPAFFCAGI